MSKSEHTRGGARAENVTVDGLYAKPVAVLIATDDGMVPTAAVEGGPTGAVGCKARLAAAVMPFVEPGTVSVTVIG